MNGEVEYCLGCLGKMTILCAWCKEPIFIGEPVTLYTPRDGSVPNHAKIHDENLLQLVGCLRWNCAESGADRAGFWMPGEDGEGKVERVPTPLEIVFGQEIPPMIPWDQT